MSKLSPQRPRTVRPPFRVVWLPAFLLAAQLAGGIAEEPPPGSDLPVMEDEPFVFQPSVVAELVFDVPASRVGWGSFDLSAAPEHDDIRVDVLVGRAAERARWTRCASVVLEMDGERLVAPATYAGVPMAAGAWDALTAHVTIADVRQMLAARQVRAEVCGEVFPLPPAERSRLAAFVRRFDDIALTIGPSAPTPPPELGEEHEWLRPEHDTTPSPA